jgi:hypothetical protein
MTGALQGQRRLRRWHRLIAMATSIQLLLWTLSGLFFAFVDIDYVRGHQFKVPVGPVALDLSQFAVTEFDAQHLVVRERLPGEMLVGVHGQSGLQWLDQTGAVARALTAEEALALGATRTLMTPNRSEWVDQPEVGSEYRGAPLPLWRLWESDVPDRVAYMDALSGEVLAVRHGAWRWWDFLWSLHIMSYTDRDTIGTWLLKILSVMALLTAVLGVWLFRATRRVAAR